MVSVTEASTPVQADASTSPAGSRGYTLYGLRIRSDFVLPVAQDRAVPAEPDIIFRRMPPTASIPTPRGRILAEDYCAHGSPVFRVQSDSGEAWVWGSSVATIHIHADLRRVDVYPEANEDLLGLLLLGQVTVFILQRRGVVCLHASAVLTEHGAMAFLGPKGQGKSSMAAAFLRRGAALVTDDVLALEPRLDGWYALPGPRMMKLWQPSVEGTLGLHEELPDLAALVPKKLLALDGRYASAQEPVRLRAAYVLDRTGDTEDDRPATTFAPINGQHGLATLIAQTSPSAYLAPAEMATLLPTYRRLGNSISLRLLRFPDGFGLQGAVCAALLADLEALP